MNGQPRGINDQKQGTPLEKRKEEMELVKAKSNLSI